MSEALRIANPPSFAELKGLYKVAMEGPKQREHYQSVGRLATQHRQGGCFRPFGPSHDASSEQEQTHNEFIVRPSHWHRGQWWGGIGESSAIAVYAWYGGAPGVVALTWQHVLNAKRDAWAEVNVCRELQNQQTTALATHQSLGDGSHSQSCVRGLRPDLCSRFSSAPSSPGGFVHVDALVGFSLRRAQELFGSHAKKPSGKYLHQALASSWERLHDAVRDQPSQAFDRLGEHRKERRRSTLPPCSKWFVCICSRNGRGHIPKMVLGIDNAIKHFSQASTREKDTLFRSQVCVLFIGRPPSRRGEDLQMILDGSVIVTWATIGWQRQNPWRSLFLGCSCLNDLAGISINGVVQHRHRLRSSGRAWAVPSFCIGELDRELRWDIALFEVFSDGAMISDGAMSGRFDPAGLEVSPANYSRRLSLARNPLRKKRVAAQCGWGRVLAAMEDDLGQANEDDLEECGSDSGAHTLDAEKCDFGEGLVDASSGFGGAPGDDISQQAAPEASGVRGLGADGGGSDMDLDELFGPYISAGIGPDDAASAEPLAPYAQAPAARSVAQPAAMEQPQRSAGNLKKKPAEVVFDGHRVSFYGTRQEYYALCCHEGHGQLCRKARTSRASPDLPRTLAQGRPLGYLAAWLSAGAHSSISSIVAVSRHDRLAARSRLAACPGAAEVMSYERPPRADEPEEPLGEA